MDVLKKMAEDSGMLEIDLCAVDAHTLMEIALRHSEFSAILVPVIRQILEKGLKSAKEESKK